MEILEDKGITYLNPSETEDRLNYLKEERETLGEGVKEVKREEPDLTALAAEIIKDFEKNKDAKRYSGIEDEILESIQAVNGKYTAEEMNRIVQNGQAAIYMELTATKSRAATSWIRDILLSPNVEPYSINATKIPSLPSNIEDMVTEHFMKELEETPATQNEQQGTASTSNPPHLPSPAAQPSGLSMKEANDVLLEKNRLMRDVKEALLEELQEVSNYEVKRLEGYVQDQLEEGGWRAALSDFIEDFCIYPNAFMKGPIIQKKKKLRWINGKPSTKEVFTFTNKRVSPMDIYPDPSATSPQEGAFIEYIRYSESELAECIGLKGFKTDAVREVLENGPTGIYTGPTYTGIEEDKAEQEKRGDSFRANEDMYHGAHYWKRVKNSLLKDWDLLEEGADDEGTTEIEAILIGHTVIKCIVNDDPLSRRPYYTASYQSIPGSFWGRSLPSLMRPSQKMCNACARALVSNMGYSSGPLLTVNIDRLADGVEMSEIVPLSVVQTTNDPTGNSGRPIEAFLVPSVAKELLAVYEKFEQKADDSTGIPKYAYGNTGGNQGSISTATGLSLMLENATKSIKDAIRHISSGLIVPRVEYEFYWLLVNKPELGYTGDITVTATGAESLTVKGAQEARQKEFLQVTANKIDQQVMGVEGRAELLREMGKSLGLKSNIVPTKLEIRRMKEEEQKRAEEMAQREAQAKQEELQARVAAVSVQSESNERISKGTQEVKVLDIQRKVQEHEDEVALRAAEIKRQSEKDNTDSLQKSTKAVMDDERARDIADQRAAIALRTFGEKEKSVL